MGGHEPLKINGVFKELAEVAGVDAAIRLSALKGGVRVYIPESGALPEDHWLIEAIGQEPGRKIADRFGGGHFTVPMGPLAGNRNKMREIIRQALEAGMTVDQVAIACGVHRRTVLRHKSGPSPARKGTKGGVARGLVQEITRMAREINATPLELFAVFRAFARRIPAERLRAELLELRNTTD